MAELGEQTASYIKSIDVLSANLKFTAYGGMVKARIVSRGEERTIYAPSERAIVGGFLSLPCLNAVLGNIRWAESIMRNNVPVTDAYMLLTRQIALSKKYLSSRSEPQQLIVR